MNKKDLYVQRETDFKSITFVEQIIEKKSLGRIQQFFFYPNANFSFIKNNKYKKPFISKHE